MARPIPASVIARLKASGGLAPISLFELQTVSGQQYFWSDATLNAPSILSLYHAPPSGVHPVVVLPNGQNAIVQSFVPWIAAPPTFHTYRSTQTRTGSIQIQNISGNSVQRDTAMIFNRYEMTNALVYYRLWSVDCEYSLFDFQGNVDDAEIAADGDSMTLSLEGFCNWSKIKTPVFQIGVGCGLTFGSAQCGSTAAVPCNNSYGTCSSTNRFNGIVLEWNGAQLNYTQVVQPAPLRLYNPRQAG